MSLTGGGGSQWSNTRQANKYSSMDVRLTREGSEMTLELKALENLRIVVQKAFY
jgi:regulation of enolase protein 1 (concanavalin A-like superfamily)